MSHLLNRRCPKCGDQHSAALRSRARLRIAGRQPAGTEHYALAATCGTGFGVPLGILDGDPGVQPERRNFVDSKAPWFEITDDPPQSQELPTRS